MERDMVLLLKLNVWLNFWPTFLGNDKFIKQQSPVHELFLRFEWNLIESTQVFMVSSSN